MRSGSVSLEFALLLPVILFVFGVSAQYLLLAHSRVYVQQAAYAAARSALVHKCPPLDLVGLLQSPVSGLGAAQCSDNPQKWEDAARWHLASASPASAFAAARDNCPRLTAAESLIGATRIPNGLTEAFRARLCYAFEPENVDVTVSWDKSDATALRRNGRAAIRATVRFRYPLTTPIGVLLSDGERGDGTRWRWGEATVLLL